MSEYPHHLRCRHYLIPEQCDLCVVSFDKNRSIEPHVAERIQAQRAARARRAVVVSSPRAIQRHSPHRRKPVPAHSGPAAQPVALHRRDIISPVFGKTFEPRMRAHDSATIPSHLRP